jgi:methyl-accepting chemotaxis protein
MVEESTAASHSLSQETSKLSDIVGSFRVGQAASDIAIRRELQKVAPHAFHQPPKVSAASGAARRDSRAAPARPARQASRAVVNGAVNEDTDWREF